MRNLLLQFSCIAFTLQSAAQLTPFKDEKNKYGYKDEKGTVAIPAQYDLALPESEYFLAVNKGYKEVMENGAPKVIAWGKWGFLNTKGQQLIPFKYDMVKPVTHGHFIVNTGAKPYGNEWLTGGKWGSIDLLQKAIFPVKYDMIREAGGDKWLVNSGGKFYFNANGVLPDHKQPGKWGIGNNEGKEVVKPAYVSLQIGWENNFIVQDALTKKYGLLSYDGKPKIPLVYDELYDFNKGAALAKKQGKYGFIGTQNQVILPFMYDEVYEKNLYAAGTIRVKKDGRIFSIDAGGREAVKSPEPFESAYVKAMAAAASTEQRRKALNNYFNGIWDIKLPRDDVKFLLEDKVRQMISTDFYVLYHFRLDQFAARKDYTAYLVTDSVYRKAMTAEQLSTLGFYTNYQMGQSGTLIYNQTTGQTAPSPKIPWQASAPYPGYGWGKLVSSDPPAPVYANTNTPAVSTFIPAEAQELVGHGYYKDTSFTDFWGDYHAITKIIQVKSISGDFAEVQYFMSNSTELRSGRILWKQITGYGSAYKPLQKWYSSCRNCSGSGYVQTSTTYKHTNDYEYTLGVKQTITTTSYSSRSCNGCGGCGMSPNDGSPYEWRIPYFSKKRK
ncbi:MAG TPA: WG repeat-containing protein [Chitinophagaceae bacterium]|nr:WG repeat-containing protein [Chitinophagaceae bacterium]HMU58790.1 WG repeat-containing protein [Chitinophagaceae bacterium]